jgi:subtilisin
MIIAEEFRPFVQDLAAATPAERRGGSLEGSALEIVSSRHGWTQNEPAFRALLSNQRRRTIVAPGRFERSAGPAGRANLASIEHNLHASVLRREPEGGAKVMLLSPLEAAVLKERFGAVAIEEDVQHAMCRTPLVRAVEPIAVPASGGRTLTVRVRGASGAIEGARVILRPSGRRDEGYEGVTDARGEARFRVRAQDDRFGRLVTLPRAGYWSRVLQDVPVQPTIDVLLQPLPVDGFDWGLRVTAAQARGSRSGQGVKAAIIDSGIAPHPSLRVRGGRNFILGEGEEAWIEDTDGHGTHCAGVVAATVREGSTWGYAPDVELYALRVFGGADGGGYASDIAAAIGWAVTAGCDIVNLSLSSPHPSGYLRRAIEDAAAAGVLLVSAAGNDGGPVGYPAGLRDVLGVSAVGRPGTFPPDSIHADAQEEITEGEYFLASFSNRGAGIDLCAPGVAITSTLPPHDFSAWDGTSMACPHVSGIAAIALCASPELSALPRMDLGMARTQQGAGLPRIDLLA